MGIMVKYLEFHERLLEKLLLNIEKDGKH